MLFIQTVFVACQAGHFGSGCHKQCRCEHGAPCNHITGVCLCLPGWRGIHCEKSQFTYSSLPFVIHQLVIFSSLECIVALCWIVCCTLFAFTDCNIFTACLPGFYGQRCSQQCLCAHGTSCNHVTGECGCPLGFTGMSCEQSKNNTTCSFLQWALQTHKTCKSFGWICVRTS